MQLVARPLAEVFAFFSRAANLEQLTPTWLRFKLLTAEPIQMGAGRVIEYRLRVHGMPCDRRTPVQSTRSAIGERFDGAVPDGDSRHGAKAAPAFRWSTLGCASCLAKAGCTTAPGLWSGSFLTKDLGIDWRRGERWFMRLLLDGDEASNNGNRQWIA